MIQKKRNITINQRNVINYNSAQKTEEKKSDSSFNLLVKSSSTDKKNNDNNTNFNIDEEIQFKNDVQKANEDDVILNVKKK
jgi:hypothetical protein